MALTQIPKEERPRERLLLRGSEALSLTELLAICLRTGSQGQSAITLAEVLLKHFGELSTLLEASVESLMEVKGVGMAKAVQLKAIFALARRFNRKGGEGKCPIHNPKEAYTLIAPELQSEKREVVAILLRDVKGRVFHHEIISIGSLAEVLVHPREIFHHALYHRAFSLILVHNHPSGDPTPSKADIELTKLLVTSGNLLGIRLDDHLIVGHHTFLSFWETGLIKRGQY